MSHWSLSNLTPSPLIFTDLDGTLLDHDNYSHKAAQPALDKLEQYNIPIIPVTSKTCTELLELRQELNNPHPFIVENGAAIYIPNGYFHQQTIEKFDDSIKSNIHAEFLVTMLGKPRQYWIDLLSSLEPTLQAAFISFNTLGVDGIVEHTQLPHARALLANQRAASEPLLWRGNDDQLNQLSQIVSDAGGQTLRGGRFVHILDQLASKGAAVHRITQLYKTAHPNKEFCTVALGDAENDLSMLEIADWPVLIKNDHRPAPNTEHIRNILYSQLNGPLGWNETVLTVLAQLNRNS